MYDYGTLTIPEEEIAMGGMALGGAFLIILFIILFFAFILAAVAIIFQGIGIMKMHEKLGLKNGWFAFIPLLNQYALGKVAEQYIKANGKKSAKFSIILPIVSVVSVIIGVSIGFLGGLLTVFFPNASEFIDLIITFITYPISIGLSIFTYVALWRVYAIFSNKNATLFTIISILFSLVQPFLVFAIRNNDPLCVEIQVPAEEIFEEAEVIE